jgi:hypothetical protein
MILRKAIAFIALCSAQIISAKIAPEITTLAEGSNILVKLPCVGCQFLYQESSSGQDAPWKTREDGNALVYLPAAHLQFFITVTLSSHASN